LGELSKPCRISYAPLASMNDGPEHAGAFFSPVVAGISPASARSRRDFARVRSGTL